MKFAVGTSLRHADHQSAGETPFKFRSSAWRPLAAHTAQGAQTADVAQICNLPYRRVALCGRPVHIVAPRDANRPADFKSAIQQSSTLRYGARRHAERGVALVITLILLSVITFMAVAFLVLSTNQRNAVTTTTDQFIARNGADTAQTRAIADMLAWMLVTTNPYSFTSARVSTNYLSTYFTNGISSPLNVNYDYNSSGAPLTLDQQRQNLTNLLLDPRPPVWITNAATGSNEFRFYLDLNRNGRFEPSGWLVVTNSQGQPIALTPNNPNNLAINYFVGDPQWIGALEFPDKTHSANNFFTYRYAYIILPASQSLDLNYIYNYAKNIDPAMPLGSDGFLRNQGAATWEINLAAFLADLNTNAWWFNTNGSFTANPYTYNCLPATFTTANRGYAFEDAFSLLRYRYGYRNTTLASAASLLGSAAQIAFGRDHVDNYSQGPVMTNAWWLPGLANDTDFGRVGNPWSGADNTNHFFTGQELFDTGKLPGRFVANLQSVGVRPSSYDRYTFYRLLSALGTDTDSASDLAKINLNYDNLVLTNGQGIASATNFYEWRPVDFFTNTANALLANAGYKFTVTNIQVWPTNLYTPSVHRLLQLAANIYDSTTNRDFRSLGYPYLPTVFRPLYRRTVIGGTNVVLINGFREVVGTTLIGSNGSPHVELDVNPLNVNQIPPLGTISTPGNERTEPLISGFPLVVGAKAGLPNFNEFSSQGYVFVSRLIEFRRPDLNKPVNSTNQMYVASITNAYGIEAWNSYSNIYPRNLQMIVRADMTAIVTNEFGTLLVSNRVVETTNRTLGPWPGWTNASAMYASFLLPWSTNGNCTFLTNASYDSQLRQFVPLTHIFPPATRDVYEIPHWFLNLNTRMRFILVDTAADRIVDYTDLNYWQPTMDLTQVLTAGSDCNPINYNNIGNQFCTNRQHGSFALNIPTLGLLSQISAGLAVMGDPDMRSFNTDPYAGLDAHAAIDGFRWNLIGASPIYPEDQSKTFYKSNVFYAPLAPYRPVYVHTSWQVNDPLVHYLVNDLDPTYASNRVDFASDSPALWNIGQVNKRYQPWGGGPGGSSNPTIPDYDFAAKDPGVTRSDAWEFPTNKYPNIGWLGRVHRGTPWQTVFLKYTNIMLRPGPIVNGVPKGLKDWQQWSGNQLAVLNVGQFDTNIVGLTNAYFDSILSMPTNDWRILDLFSTAFNANSARGRLSVNQTNLAAWSAILSGVNVMPDLTTNTFIPPAGVYTNALQPGIPSIVTGIINARTNFPNNSYQRLGDIFATPELTVASPFLTGNIQRMNDEVVERIPQQIAGLLKGSEQPRFVIYAFGQALKPAPQSIIPGGPYLGVCTNYQITAEVATRTVVRIDDALPVPGRPYKPHAVIENFNVLPPD